jgi:TPP-dependent pyruvate/acetoin dehydrogenase alpha subunit
MRRLYRTGGVMRSKDKEYRQRNHRPSYQHENPVEEHRDIMTRIWAFEYEVIE